MMSAVGEPWQTDHRITRLLDYWRAKRPAGGLLPGRAAISPVELGPGMLPHVALIDVINGGERFRFRLVGTKLNADAGLDLTGRFVDELRPDPDYAKYITGLYRMTIQHRLPVYSETRYRAASGRIGQTHRLLCPLATDGISIDMFACAQVTEADDQCFAEAPTLTFAASFEPLCALVIPG